MIRYTAGGGGLRDSVAKFHKNSILVTLSKITYISIIDIIFKVPFFLCGNKS